jgi:hypothetical protein
MLTNGREIQERENSTEDLVSMLTEHSASFHNWDHADTSILLEEDSSSRPQMEEKLNTGTSINNH